jgi:hypothetical protein
VDCIVVAIDASLEGVYGYCMTKEQTGRAPGAAIDDQEELNENAEIEVDQLLSESEGSSPLLVLEDAHASVLGEGRAFPDNLIRSLSDSPLRSRRRSTSGLPLVGRIILGQNTEDGRANQSEVV